MLQTIEGVAVVVVVVVVGESGGGEILHIFDFLNISIFKFYTMKERYMYIINILLLFQKKIQVWGSGLFPARNYVVPPLWICSKYFLFLNFVQ